MRFNYKCPVCRANNILSKDNLICRRCKSDLSTVYKIRAKVIIRLIKIVESE